jgi:hypothetical protein
MLRFENENATFIVLQATSHMLDVNISAAGHGKVNLE